MSGGAAFLLPLERNSLNSTLEVIVARDTTHVIDADDQRIGSDSGCGLGARSDRRASGGAGGWRDHNAASDDGGLGRRHQGSS